MATRKVAVQVPEEVLTLVGSAEVASARATEALVLGLLRDGSISQGQAARLLNVSRWDLLDIMARFAIPSGPETAEEMRKEIEQARRSLGQMDVRGGDQR